MSAPFFTGLQAHDIDVGDVMLHALVGGDGPPLVLLHGYPQTHVMWHKVAPLLQQHFTLVIPDLRGYGASSKPPSRPDCSNQSKRAMAADIRALMTALGYSRFGVCAHDRGARVAHRLGLDHPSVVQRMMLLDIAPTREMYALADDAFARAYWHWFFLIRPAPHPEQAISADSDRWFKSYFRYAPGGSGIEPFDAAAFEHYLSAMRDPEAVRASCDDYRAAATLDIAHDDADGDQRLACPLRVLWGQHGVIEACFDPLELWRRRAEQVDGRAVPGGHYLAEECPALIADEILSFFTPSESA